MCSAVFLCACGKKNDASVISTSPATAEADKEQIYNLENIDLPITGKYSINYMDRGKDYLFLVANMYETENVDRQLFKVSLSTGEVSEIPFVLGENEDIDNLAGDQNDNVYIFKLKIAKNPMVKRKVPS